MNGHKVTMLGTGLIGLFYTRTLHGQRNRDRVHVAVRQRADNDRGSVREVEDAAVHWAVSRPRS